MKAIERSEVLGLAEYEPIRERFRARIMAEKKIRRLQVGPHVSVLFESRDTALLQIQEMLRTERITRPAAIQHEIDTYNELVPGDGELSCTLMIEIVDAVQRDAFLRSALGLEEHVWLVSSNARIAGRERARGDSLERTTAVHYLRFPLPEALANELRAAGRGAVAAPNLEVEIDHPAYAARGALALATLLELGRDLES